MSTTAANEIQEMIAGMMARLDLRPCCGCDGCGTRCVEGIGITREEFTALVDYLETQPPEEVRRVLGQDKEFSWGSGTVRACLFRDTERRHCFVYPVRPLICRLFGFVAWLPCPLGEVAQVLPDGLEIIHWYRQFDRRTFREWVQEDERVQKLLRGLEVSVKCET